MRKRGTSRNKTSLDRAYFAHNLFVYSKHVSWDDMGRKVSISVLLAIHENLRNKL